LKRAEGSQSGFLLSNTLERNAAIPPPSTSHYSANQTPATKDLIVDDALLQHFKDYLKMEKIDYAEKDLRITSKKT
jgi:hypothetical protein